MSLHCFYCGHADPLDLGFTFSYLEQRFVPACHDETWCDFRECAALNEDAS